MILNEESGIYLFHSFDNIIENNTANSNEIDGIALVSSDDNIVGNNTANLNKGDGFDLTESNNNTIKDNFVNSNNDGGISLYSSSDNNTVKNNIALNNSFGIYLLQASRNIIENNTANNEIDGVHLQSSSNNIVENNTANLNKDDGIDLVESDNNTIKDNNVNSNKDAGISLYSLNDNNIVKNNIALNNGNGIYLLQSSNSIIENNTADSNENVGIVLLLSYNNIVVNNTANSNEIDGIGLSSSYNNIVENNTANLNKDDGVELLESDDNTIKNNTVNSNVGTGISLYSVNANNTIENNIVLNNHKGIYLNSSSSNTIKDNSASNNRWGIYLSSSPNNSIKENIAKTNKEAGISLYLSSNNNTVEKNIASNNGYGIYLSSSLNNIIKNNVANSNNKHGIWLSSSDDNVIEKNIASNNYGGGLYAGIYLSSSSNNIIIENIANSNYEKGIWLSLSCNNILKKNDVSRSDYGIHLYNSTGNNVYHNNIINNTIQTSDDRASENNWFHLELLGNYWSDYNGTDDDGDGLGDIDIPHPDDDYDWYPFVNKSGWLTFLVSPEYWDLGTVYQGRSKSATFEIQNTGVHDLTILSISADQNIDISGINPSMKIQNASSKTFNVTIDTTNLEGNVLRTIEISSDATITPNKTILIYGFVKPPVHDVRITSIDFDSRIIKGQMDVFNVGISNHGSFDVHNLFVVFKDDGEVMGNRTIPELLAGENETVSFNWDTTGVASGVHEIAIEVRLRNKDLLDSIKVKVNVLPDSEATTLIVTNFDRFREHWGKNESHMLEKKLIKLSYSPCVDGVIINVGEDTNCSHAYELWDLNLQDPQSANDAAKHIKKLIDAKLKSYTGIKYIIIVGDDRIIPYYRIRDNTDKPLGPESWRTEDEYRKLNRDSTVGSALNKNMFLTDNVYATNKSIEWKTTEVSIPELFVPAIPIGRLVESPGEISATIDAFYQKEHVSPDKIFVTGYDFMKDSALYCGSLLKEEMGSEPEIIVNITPDYSEDIIRGLLNTSNNIILVFQHADHNQFYIYGDREINITSQNIAQSVADLNSSIVYSLGCHSGLNVPINASDNDFDLVQAYAQKGVLAYIAPTGYSIGSYWARAAHELLISYFTRYLCDGLDAGTALTLAKQEYWATNYDFNYFDEQVLETTTLYGLPMARINMPHPTTSGNESEMRIMGLEPKTTEKPDTIVIRPTHTLKSAHGGQYYITTSGEHLSDPRKPVQPKEIRIFHPTSKKMLHGAVMTSGKYKTIKSFVPQGYCYPYLFNIFLHHLK
jgi:parallel beta-helix repeat protein